MSYSIAVLGFLVAFPHFDGGSPAASNITAAASPRLEPAPVEARTRAAGVELESVARVLALLPDQTELPICADLDKRRQLRGRLDPAVVEAARWFLNLPMGAGRFLSLNGKRYAFCLERHYHPPGYTRGPQGWHKGVTVYDAV
ncbi:MAG TPA: hypothetical protein VM686_36295 [Polyangiaceae bacterium]|nr:hypothetical protein [Polyangiaceae bacterium]